MTEDLIIPAFIIAHKYVRGYPSYTEYYINNIQKHYPEALTIVVDNNSEHRDDIFKRLLLYNNVVLLDNNIDCKFELGAYQVGMKYILDNGLQNYYDYFMCTQDLYILKNKYDFSKLKGNNVGAAPIIGWSNDLEIMHIVQPVLEHFNLFNRLEETDLCWCSSFVVSKEKISYLYKYFRQIVITDREGSKASERYLGRLFLELNNGTKFSIDGSSNMYNVHGCNYDCHSVNVYAKVDKHFCKVSQKKTELTYER
jgi:hypothetical protein